MFDNLGKFVETPNKIIHNDSSIQQGSSPFEAEFDHIKGHHDFFEASLIQITKRIMKCESAN